MSKIALLGNFRVNYTSESDYKYTLEQLGYEVVALQETEVSGQQVLDAALQCEALMYVHTHSWKTLGMPLSEVFTKLKEAGIPTFTYHLDLWMGLKRQTDMGQDDYWNIEHFFTVDKEMADYLNDNGISKGHYLHAGVIKRDCFLADPDPTRKEEVIFTGSYDYHEEHPYRRQLLDMLRYYYGRNFRRYGRPAPDQRDAQYIMGDKLNTVLASAKVVVGDSLCKGFNKADYWSNRCYETLGKGGFLIHPYIQGMEQHFEDKKHLVFYTFGDFHQLTTLIDYYRTHDEEREAIRIAGHEHVKNNHTFTERMQTMLETIGLSHG